MEIVSTPAWDYFDSTTDTRTELANPQFMDEVRPCHLPAAIQRVDGGVGRLQSRLCAPARVDQSDSDVDAVLIIMDGLLADLNAWDVKDGTDLGWSVVSRAVSKVSDVRTSHDDYLMRKSVNFFSSEGSKQAINQIALEGFEHFMRLSAPIE
jgi:hypothetical protein